MGLSDLSKVVGLSSFNPTKWHGKDWLTAALGAASGGVGNLAAGGLGGLSTGALFDAGVSTAGGALKNQLLDSTVGGGALSGLTSALSGGVKQASTPMGGALMQMAAQIMEQQQRQQQMDNRLGEVKEGFESPENARRIRQMLNDIYGTTRERGDIQATAGLGDSLRQLRQRGGARGSVGGSVSKAQEEQAKAGFLGARQQSALQATAGKQRASDALSNLRRNMEAAVRKGQWAPAGSDIRQMQRQAFGQAAASVPQNVLGSIFAEEVAPTVVGLGARQLGNY